MRMEQSQSKIRKNTAPISNQQRHGEGSFPSPIMSTGLTGPQAAKEPYKYGQKPFSSPDNFYFCKFLTSPKTN